MPTTKDTSAAEQAPDAPPRVLDATELAMIENWVRLADTLGVPRSLAQIYGLIYGSRAPVSAQDCVDALKISRSSAGQGLKALRDLGAIKPAFELGARREAFVIEPDLGVLIHGFLEGRLMPAFSTFFDRLVQLEAQDTGPGAEFRRRRVKKLRRWGDKLNRARKWL